MKSFAKLAVAAIGLCSLVAAPARAEKFDVMTMQCGQLLEVIDNGSAKDAYGLGAVLYWIAGYMSPEEKSTVIDFNSLKTDFDKIVADCREQPKVGIMTTAEKHLNENGTPAGKDAMDIATVTCEAVLNTDKKDEEGLGLLLMWVAGYHAYGNDDTVFDGEAFEAAADEIGKTCAENPEKSFFKVSEDEMGNDED